MDVAEAVRAWQLQPHPEGGFFRETYRSALGMAPPGWPGERALVGPDPAAGQQPQVLVPGGAWQSATPCAGPWSLTACLVTPGFDFADFELRQ
jgi:uncharacterized protein